MKEKESKQHRRLSTWRSTDTHSDQGIHSLQEALEQVDVHALKFAFYTRPWSLKILWILMFLGGCTAAIYYIRTIILEYYSYQTATKISTRIQEEYDYPPIYLCPRYNWDLAKTDQLKLSREAVVYAASLAQKNDSHRPLPTLETAEILVQDDLHKFIKLRDDIKEKTYADFYKWMAVDSTSFIKEFNGIESNEFKPVFVANPIQDTKPVSYRACYNVSAGSYNPHTGEVFYLQYDIAKPETNLGFDNDFAFIKDDHRVVLEKDRIYLRTNRVTTIRLSMKEYSRRETEKSKCKKKEEIREPYSQEYCRYQCFAAAVYRCSQCQVLTDDTRLVGHNLLCTWSSHPNLTTQCGKDGYDDRSYKKCLTACKPLCEYKTYDFSIAVAVLNSDYSVNDTRISLWIYFLVDDGILLYEEIPISNIESVISNVGGQLGLWTGASILTIFEFVYLILQFFCANWEVKKQEKQEKKRRRAESLRQTPDTQPINEDGKPEYEQAPTSDTDNDDVEKGKPPSFDETQKNSNANEDTPIHSPITPAEEYVISEKE